ncbi:nucleoporin Pom152 [Schizosaccharomyces japonicus yFS275]|uniref:Nucleoporin Pom152 n=1 Tax=Schizosaccharomyces japonicus (strain yFS275 / FY16936) TaxID=402676 RepID=B6JZ12_SCHJY|nr:nucleoporin Pom152 [Schizosaccharomyces japonicus yFS275]EEB06780.1 nucleoporin Pom152 [Schizosaccharomyces japonicus yFS275]
MSQREDSGEVRGPLIPEAIIDAPSQRLYAIAALVALQAYKLYDFVLFNASGASDVKNTTFLLKWILLDASYCYILPLFRIPWLSFQPSTTLLQIALFAIVDVLLCSITGFNFSSIALFLYSFINSKELTLTDQRVNPQDIINNSSRILGQYTVHILPESSAKINPYNEHYCLPSVDEFGEKKKNTAPITIPIRFNSTTPYLIEYAFVDLETLEENRYNISGRALRRILDTAVRDNKDGRLYTVQFKAPKRGLYRLTRVIDKSKLAVRIYRSEAVIVTCPQARLRLPQDSQTKNQKQNQVPRCVDDANHLLLDVQGVAPLKIRYSRWIGNDETVSSIESAKPTGFDAPAEFLSAPEEIYFGNNVDLKFAQSSNVAIFLNTTLALPGEWTYGIHSVTDALGNTVSFPVEVALQDKKHVPNYPFISSVYVYERPTLRFEGCSMEHPVKLLPGGEAKLRVSTNVHLEKDKQIRFQLLRYPLGTDLESADKTPTFSSYVSLYDLHNGIAVHEDGIYVIDNVSTEFCSGTILAPSQCLVTVPPKAEVSVHFEEIADQCAGSIGARAELEFEGVPPFGISYRMSRNKEQSPIQYAHIDRTRYQLYFTPKEAGKYRYVILGLEDTNYGYRELKGPEFTKEQTVFPLADASFDKNSPDDLTKNCCIGDSLDIPVTLSGSAPWKLEYEILRDNKREKVHILESNNPKCVIHTPSLKYGSQYTVALVSVEDANGCKRSLRESDVIINVRRQRPTASFYPQNKKFSVEDVEGTELQIPLRLVGEAPWQLEYERVGTDGSVSKHMTTLYDANSNLKVNVAGTYKLISVRDSSCPGSIPSPDQTFVVSWLPKPLLSLSNAPKINSTTELVYEHPHICENANSAFDVSLVGTPPFLLQYEKYLVDENGKIHQREHRELSTMQNFVTLKTDSAAAGTYYYEFVSISDLLYTDVGAFAKDNDGKLKTVIVNQFVNKAPKAAFTEPGKVYTFCLNTNVSHPDAQKIPIRLDGQGPFDISFEIKNELSGSVMKTEVHKVEGPVLNFTFPQKQLTLGRHKVRILKVVDANKCAYHVPHNAPTVTVGVAELASLTPLDSREYYCVGDRLAFSLQGIPPFNVEYSFLDKKLQASTQGHSFSRIAETPGNFTLLSIADKGSPCRAVFKKPIHYEIHDIPTVRISDGREVVENIHEGDRAEISFQFTGTPPFTFTYSRHALTRKGTGKVLETHTVTGIEEYEYKILSSIEGVYVVNSVQDRYCRFPRSSTFKGK